VLSFPLDNIVPLIMDFTLSAVAAIKAGKTSGGAFAACFYLKSEVTDDRLWIGGLDLSKGTLTALQRMLTDKLSVIERPQKMFLCRYTNQAIVQFSSTQTAKRALAAIKEDLAEDWKNCMADYASVKTQFAFLERMSEKDRKKNSK
jgi:hypothetical protein